MRSAPIAFFLLALVTYSQNVAPILDWRCTECHAEGNSLVLTRFPFFSETTEDQPTIVNRILSKVQGIGADKARMPPGNRPKLTQTQVATIQQWLEQGLAQ